MSLIAFNKTTAPLVLVVGGTSTAVLAPSTAPGVRGPRTSLTSELKGLLLAKYAAMEAKRLAGQVDFIWTDEPEYPTGSLQVAVGGTGNGSAVEIVTDEIAGLVPPLVGINGAVPVDDGENGVAFRRLSVDDLEVAFAITSFIPGFVTTKE